VRLRESRHVCFLNADILLGGGWLRRAKEVFSAAGDLRIVACGQRLYFALRRPEYESPDFTQGGLIRDIDARVHLRGPAQHDPRRRRLLNFTCSARFVMGRLSWDSWLTGWLINVTDTVRFGIDAPMYHMNHVRH
jgi:hypothetical protein